MPKLLKLDTEWKGTQPPPAADGFNTIVAAGEMYGPFITNNKERLQVQYNAQKLESIRISKLNRFDANYAIESQPFYRP